MTADRSTGTLSVIDVARAETDPAGSVVRTVRAGCQPVRVVVSSDGSVVWVTTRGRDAMLAFSSASLSSGHAALIADVRVGAAPVGLELVRGGQFLVVADSDRFDSTGESANLEVVGVRAALAGKPAVLGSIPTGRFPREFAVAPGDRVPVK